MPETIWESSDTTKEKILTAILHTISGDTAEDRMDQSHKVPIKDVKCVGKYIPMYTHPVLVEFYHKSDADFLLSNRTHLPKGVYIDKQYSEETEKEHHRLRPILRMARKHDNFKGKCKMEGPNLIIKGRNYSSKNLHLLPDEINGYRATSRIDENEKVRGFFRELNPLSNFHPTQFSINDITYHSSEQFIQHQKSVMFGDQSTEKMILMAEAPLECKSIGNNISNFNATDWKENAKAMCCLLAKFEQHPLLAKLLTRTNGYKLVECCNDKVWGTGVPLHVPNALKPTEWHSQGLLGEMLETVRDIINQPLAAPMEANSPIASAHPMKHTACANLAPP